MTAMCVIRYFALLVWGGGKSISCVIIHGCTFSLKNGKLENLEMVN